MQKENKDEIPLVKKYGTIGYRRYAEKMHAEFPKYGVLPHQIAARVAFYIKEDKRDQALYSSMLAFIKGKPALDKDAIMLVDGIVKSKDPEIWKHIGLTLNHKAVIEVPPTEFIQFLMERGGSFRHVDGCVEVSYGDLEPVIIPVVDNILNIDVATTKVLSSWFTKEGVTVLPYNVTVMTVYKAMIGVVEVKAEGTERHFVMKNAELVSKVVVLPKAIQSLANGKHAWKPEAREAFNSLFGEDARKEWNLVNYKKLVSSVQRRYKGSSLYSYINEFFRQLILTNQKQLAATILRRFQVFIAAKVREVDRAYEGAVQASGPGPIAKEVMRASREVRGYGEGKGNDVSKNLHIGAYIPNALSTANKGAALVSIVKAGEKANNVPYETHAICGVLPGHMLKALIPITPKCKLIDIVADKRNKIENLEVRNMFNELPFSKRGPENAIIISDAWSTDADFTKKLVDYMFWCRGIVRKENGAIEKKENPIAFYKNKQTAQMLKWKGQLIDFIVKVNILLPDRMQSDYYPPFMEDLCELDTYHIYSAGRPHNMEIFVSNIRCTSFVGFKILDVTIDTFRDAFRTICMRSIKGNLRRCSWLFGAAVKPDAEFILTEKQYPDIMKKDIAFTSPLEFLSVSVEEVDAEADKRLNVDNLDMFGEKGTSIPITGESSDEEIEPPPKPLVNKQPPPKPPAPKKMPNKKLDPGPDLKVKKYAAKPKPPEKVNPQEDVEHSLQVLGSLYDEQETPEKPDDDDDDQRSDAGYGSDLAIEEDDP